MNSLEMNILGIKENAYMLSIKHNLSEEAKLIEEEEERLFNLLREERAVGRFTSN